MIIVNRMVTTVVPLPLGVRYLFIHMQFPIWNCFWLVTSTAAVASDHTNLVQHRRLQQPLVYAMIVVLPHEGIRGEFL